MAETNSSSSPISDVFAGHLGNLTTDQEQTLITFKENLVKSNLYTPTREEKKASHDDATLLRFLRARSWEIIAAEKQFANHVAWLEKHNVLKILRDLTPEDMLHTQKFYPRWTGRRDKLGVPLFVYRLASLIPFQQEILAVPAEKRYERVAALSEYSIHFYLPLCTYLPHPNNHIPISSTVSIIDLEDVSLSLLWQLRSHFQEATRMNNDNYPETICTMAIVNAPSFFPTVWNWIKGWFDQHTRDKIQILGIDPGVTLREFIDPKDLPMQYGGELDWKFEDEPNLDEDAKRVLGELPKGPAAFVAGKVIQPIPLT